MKKSLQGHLLIAASRLTDPNFLRSVVLLVQHNDDGALGLVLNRPLEITIRSAWEQVSEQPCLADGLIYQGGPCDGPLMALHDRKSLSEVEVLAGVHFTTEKGSLEQLVTDDAIMMRFFVGYSGWTAGQLEEEISQGGWLVAVGTKELIFSEDEEQWNGLYKVIARAKAYPGIDPDIIPDDPSVN